MSAVCEWCVSVMYECGVWEWCVSEMYECGVWYMSGVEWSVSVGCVWTVMYIMSVVCKFCECDVWVWVRCMSGVWVYGVWVWCVKGMCECVYECGVVQIGVLN